MDLQALATRYGTNVNSIKARLSVIGAPPSGELTADIEEQLEAIAEHLESGESIRTFHFTPTSPVEIIPIEERSALAPAAPPAAPVDFETLSKIYGFLQKAADNEWHLPTSVIRSLTGATPKGKYWKRFGFEFTPASKHGIEKAWAVTSATWDFPIR